MILNNEKANLLMENFYKKVFSMLVTIIL